MKGRERLPESPSTTNKGQKANYAPSKTEQKKQHHKCWKSILT